MDKAAQISIDFLKSSNFNIEDEIEDLCALPTPEEFYKKYKKTRNLFGLYAHGTYLRLIQLVQNKNLIEKLPKMSFKYGDLSTPSSRKNTYRLILTRLSYFCLYSLDKMELEDEFFTDAVANPMKKVKYDDELDKDLISYYLIASHAALLICATKWIAAFSKDEMPAQLKYIFINPMLTYTATLLGYSPNDPILNWGASIMRGLCSESIKYSKEFLLIDKENFETTNKIHFNRNLFIKMANGDLELSKKLGAKLYTEFEKEIFKVFDALGFFVSHTTIGKKRVDLIVSTPKPNSYTFLVDAKSSKANYSLPMSDERAIKDYILSHQENTDILPPLKFFLIVSSSPSKTLEPKLNTLTNQVGIPVRFISASVFTYLIDNSNWTIYPQDLINAITKSNAILDKKWSENLIQSVNQKKNAYTKYVELLTN